MVNAYGAMTPLNQCAGINVPEPRMITVTVWDKTLIDSVDKAIRESNLGINPCRRWNDASSSYSRIK